MKTFNKYAEIQSGEVPTVPMGTGDDQDPELSPSGIRESLSGSCDLVKLSLHDDGGDGDGCIQGSNADN